MITSQKTLLVWFCLLAIGVIYQPAYSQSSKEVAPNKNQAKKGYEIRIRIEGLSDSLCYLANYFGDKQYLRDSAYADKNGNVVFKGDTALKGGMYMAVMPGKKYFDMIVDKEQHFEMSTVEGNYIGSMKTIGSNDNSWFYGYVKLIGSKSQEITALKQELEKVKDTDSLQAKLIQSQMAEIDSTVLKFKSDMSIKNPGGLFSALLKATEEFPIPAFPPNPDGTRDSLGPYYFAKDHFFDNIDLQDDRLLFTPVFHPKLEFFFTKMVLQFPDSINKEADRLISKLKPGSEIFKYVVWWITNHYETSKIMGMDAVFVHMVENYYTKEKAFWADDAQLFKIQDRARVLKPILVGKKVKNLVMADDKGVMRSLYDVKAKYTILYFWDPDCGHCKKVTPKLKEYFDQVKQHGIAVYAVCTEVEIDKWKKFIADYKLDWINVADGELRNNFRSEFDITSTPQIFLLDSNKQIFAKRIEVAALSEILNRDFKKSGIELPIMKAESHEGTKLDAIDH